MKQTVNNDCHILQFILTENAPFPNNPFLPVVLYRQVLSSPSTDFIQELFAQHNWHNAWVNGIHPFHHYHSVAHEVLAVSSGWCEVLLGGEEGRQVKIERGDVLVLPAGVAHKRVHASPDFTCVGAYPNRQNFDMNYGNPGERPAADENIQKTVLPSQDPLFGKNGPLKNAWKLLEYDGL